MPKRTDVHRPSVIEPEKYVFVGVDNDRCDDVGACLVLREERERIEAFRKAMGARYAHPSNGECACCGAHCIYTAVFYYPDEKVMLRFGFTCCEKMHIGDPKKFRSFKRSMKNWKDFAKGKTRAKGLLAEAGLELAWELYERNQDQDYLRLNYLVRPREYEDDVYNCGCEHRSNCDRCHGHGYYQGPLRKVVMWESVRPYRTLVDMVANLIKYGNLSPKQLDYLRALTLNLSNWKEKQEEFARRREEERAQAEDCPSGRVDVCGVLVKVEERWSEYLQHDREVWTVKDDRGFLVWGNRPTGVQGAQRGNRVRFRATLYPSDSDPKFGFYKRPAAAILVQEEEQHAT